VAVEFLKDICYKILAIFIFMEGIILQYTYLQFTKDVMDDAYHADIPELKAVIFQRIKQLVPFDCGRWLTRTSVEESYLLSGMYIYNLPADRDTYILPRFHHQDFLYKAIVADMGKAVNIESLMSDDEWFKSDLYVNTFKDYGLSRACSIIVPCRYTGVYNGFGFYRKDKAHKFTEEYRELLESAAHFSSRVLRSSYFHHLQKSQESSSKNCAIFDHLGRMVDSTPLFKSCVASLINKDFIELPSDWFSPDVLGKRFTLGKAQFSVQYLKDLYLVSLESNTVFDELTPTQKLVAELIGQSLSNKEIAKEMGISKYTVEEHAKNISKVYGGFGQGISGRLKMAAFLSGKFD